MTVEPQGAEFLVNTITSGEQENPSVTALSGGGFVVAWQSDGQDVSEGFYRVYGQRYDADGTAQGAEFLINTNTVDDRTSPSVTDLSGGGFVVTWQSIDQDGDFNGVYGRLYNADGTPGTEFQVNTTTDGNQDRPSVAGLADGGFVVTWESGGQDSDLDDFDGVYGQRYNAEGMAQGGEFQVNTHTAHAQNSPSVTGLSGGGFVVAWQSWNQDNDRWGVYGQRYNSDGMAQGGEFQVNTHTPDAQNSPSVTGLSGGGFVVAWQSANQDMSGEGIYGRLYNADGTAQGGEFLVPTTTQGNQRDPSVTALDNGGFVVAWESEGQDGDGDGVYARRFNADGTAQGAEFVVNTYITGHQNDPSVTALSNGGFVVAWESADQDGDGAGVYARRFGPAETETGIETIRGTDGDDTLTGGDGKDRIVGLAGADVLDGGADRDVLDGGAGADALDGGAGRDRATYKDSNAGVSNAGVTVSLVSGTTGVGGFAQGDTLANIEQLTGSDYDDRLTGDDGNNWLRGGAGADTLDGGAGRDRAAYTGSDAGVNVNLATGRGQGGHAQGDSLTGIEGLTGSDYDDTLTGDDGNNWLRGGLGADTLNGGDGIDTAIYARSADAVDVNLADSNAEQGGHAQGDALAGIENLIGSDHNDTFTGDTGNNRFDGGLGNDSLDGGLGNDWLTGGLGADTLDGGAGGFDRAIYRGSDDAVSVNLADSNAEQGGHAAGDVLTGIEVLIGSDFADTLTGDGGDNRFDGGEGNDEIDGGAGDDRLDGRAGDDALTGGVGDDVLIGRAGNDEIDGGDGNDWLIGSEGEDYLTGGAGADTLNGGAGADQLDGGDGADTLKGGAGIDALYGDDGDDELFGDAGDDSLNGGDGADRLDGGAGTDGLTGGNGDDELFGGAGDDVLNGNAGADMLKGGADNDFASGQAGDDELFGDAGDDRLDGGAGADELDGGAGDDRLDGGDGADTLKGGADDDSLNGGAGEDSLDGGTGDDWAVYSGSNAAVDVNLGDSNAEAGGHAQGDVLTGIDNLIGSALNDTLTGDARANRLDGGVGEDQLTGGGGADSLDGGDGIDRATYANSGVGVTV